MKDAAVKGDSDGARFNLPDRRMFFTTGPRKKSIRRDWSLLNSSSVSKSGPAKTRQGFVANAHFPLCVYSRLILTHNKNENSEFPALGAEKLTSDIRKQRRIAEMIEQWFLIGGHASQGVSLNFQADASLTRSTIWKVFERESVPSNLLI